MNKFDHRLQTITPELYLKIAKIDELKGLWTGGSRLNAQLLSQLKQSSLITSTGASTRIEGARLTDKEVENVIRGLHIQDFKNRDEQEVRGYFELLENIFNTYNTLVFNENLIKSFHNELLKYVDKDQMHKGDYKKLENKVEMRDEANNIIETIFETTPPYLTPIEMHEVIEWTINSLKEKRIHPLVIIGNFIVEFLKIHPFQDGNGRLSRVLTNLLMLKEGYTYVPYSSHEKLIEENKAQYYIALRQSQKTFNTKEENIIPWMNFLLEILLKQAQYAIEISAQEHIEAILTKKQLLVWKYLLHVEEATPREIAQNTQIGKDTIRQILNKLINMKKIEKLGLGAGTYYRIIKN